MLDGYLVTLKKLTKVALEAPQQASCHCGKVTSSNPFEAKFSQPLSIDKVSRVALLVLLRQVLKNNLASLIAYEVCDLLTSSNGTESFCLNFHCELWHATN